jgi:hypothetical protein
MDLIVNGIPASEEIARLLHGYENDRKMLPFFGVHSFSKTPMYCMAKDEEEANNTLFFP